MDESHVWIRRTTETHPAYEAFRVYLKLRSCSKVAAELGKSAAVMERWSREHSWVDRCIAYDRYIGGADTDGMVHVVADARDKNLALMDKLRGLLDSRLDDFIARRDDPTMRWTQACIAMTKIEANSLMMGKNEASTEKIETIMAMMDKVIELQNKVPEEA
jgi:hypothetical protein